MLFLLIVVRSIILVGILLIVMSRLLRFSRVRLLIRILTRELLMRLLLLIFWVRLLRRVILGLVVYTNLCMISRRRLLVLSWRSCSHLGLIAFRRIYRVILRIRTGLRWLLMWVEVGLRLLVVVILVLKRLRYRVIVSGRRFHRKLLIRRRDCLIWRRCSRLRLNRFVMVRNRILV